MENFNLKHDLEQKDPWLGKFTYNIAGRADPTSIWNKLLINSTHVNHLVTLDKSWKLEPDKVNKHINDGCIIVNMSGDPFRGWEGRVASDLLNYTDNFVVLSGDSKYFQQPMDHVCYFPFWYLHQKYTHNPLPVIDQPRQYPLSSLNKIARYQRIENFIKLRKKPYFDRLLFGMLYHYDQQAVRRQTPKAFYNSDIIAEFELLIPDKPIVMSGSGHAINLPAYSDSYINLVTETSIYDDTIFVSEKTWKPFMSGQFGLWLSNPGTVAFLRDIGFDMFDDIFNNHDYDKEVNLNQRIDMIHATIDQIIDQDLDIIFQNTLERRQANINLLYSAELETMLTRQCQDHCAIIQV